MTRGKYKTRQRQEILRYLKSSKNIHKTVKDIQEYFQRENIDVGLTTIYRHLNALIREGLVKKYRLNNDSSAYFEYVEEESSYHCHCNSCGKTIHIDCDEITAFQEHIKVCHGFQVDSFETTFYGICCSCNEKMKK